MTNEERRVVETLGVAPPGDYAELIARALPDLKALMVAAETAARPARVSERFA